MHTQSKKALCRGKVGFGVFSLLSVCWCCREKIEKAWSHKHRGNRKEVSRDDRLRHTFGRGLVWNDGNVFRKAEGSQQVEGTPVRRKQTEPWAPRRSRCEGSRWRGWWCEMRPGGQGLTLEPPAGGLCSGDGGEETLRTPRSPAWQRVGMRRGAENKVLIGGPHLQWSEHLPGPPARRAP